MYTGCSVDPLYNCCCRKWQITQMSSVLYPFLSPHSLECVFVALHSRQWHLHLFPWILAVLVTDFGWKNALKVSADMPLLQAHCLSRSWNSAVPVTTIPSLAGGWARTWSKDDPPCPGCPRCSHLQGVQSWVQVYETIQDQESSAKPSPTHHLQNLELKK